MGAGRPLQLIPPQAISEEKSSLTNLPKNVFAGMDKAEALAYVSRLDAAQAGAVQVKR